MTAHHRMLSNDRLRCACGWSVPWPAMGRWGEIWDAHIRAVESAPPQGAPATPRGAAGAVTMGSPVVPPAPVASSRHEYIAAVPDANGQGAPSCSCGWRGVWHTAAAFSRPNWLEHAVAAYQQEEVITIDDDDADCDALAGDDVAGSEVRE